MGSLVASDLSDSNEPPLKRRYGTNLLQQDGTYGAKLSGGECSG
jgi:hypothetical protein